MSHPTHLKRLVWHSRRGMLELDLMLEPFARQELHTLSSADQAAYARLLEAQDPDIYAWLLGNETCPDRALGQIVERIRHYATHSTLS